MRKPLLKRTKIEPGMGGGVTIDTIKKTLLLLKVKKKSELNSKRPSQEEGVE